jgi:UDP-glucuronate 4-epimerase
MAPYRLYNIGNNQPVQLMDYIHLIEENIGKKAEINFLPLQPGDVPKTYANIDDIERDTNYRLETPIEKGIANFVDWYKDYYKVK